MKRLVCLLSLALLGAATLGMGQAPDRPGDPGAVRFVSYDLLLMPSAPVGAWQAQIRAKDSGTVKIVGIEGAEEAGFDRPPFYDPAALHEDQLRERIVLAAYSTTAVMPAGGLPADDIGGWKGVRVARLHLQVSGADPVFEISNITLGDALGKPIGGNLRLIRSGENK